MYEGVSKEQVLRVQCGVKERRGWNLNKRWKGEVRYMQDGHLGWRKKQRGMVLK